jgi:hypothetical protein
MNSEWKENMISEKQERASVKTSFKSEEATGMRSVERAFSEAVDGLADIAPDLEQTATHAERALVSRQAPEPPRTPPRPRAPRKKETPEHPPTGGKGCAKSPKIDFYGHAQKRDEKDESDHSADGS